MTDQVLVEAAAAAGYAPSVHNTQPWHWQVNDNSLELYADRSRQLRTADPDGRLLIMSCGAALHHARVALAAQGRAVEVARLADEPLATITLLGETPVLPEVTRQFDMLALRHTDRRPVSSAEPTDAAVDEVRRAGTAEGVNFQRLTEDQVLELGVAAAHANEIELDDPDHRLELAYWTGEDHPKGTGLPAEVVPHDSTEGAVVPGRDFVRAGKLATTEGNDRAAVYLQLFGDGDEPVDWLRAGEAMSAAWLAATENNLSVLPFSSVIEVPSTRAVMRQMLAFLGYPYLVLRLGNPLPGEPPHTPRLPLGQTIS